MGGNSPSTVQPNGSPLASLFGGSQGYQQPNQITPAIQQPTYGAPALTPAQAALATQARMQARTPLTPPVVQQQKKPGTMIEHGNGDSHGRGSGGAW